MDKIKMKVAGVEFEVGDIEQAKKLIELKLVTENGMSPDWANQFIQATYQVFVNLNPDTQRINKLRVACGFIENGTSTSVNISQDDATKTWTVSDSHPSGGFAHGQSIREAIDNLEIKDDTA